MPITAILGAGVMGETLLAGLLRHGQGRNEPIVAEKNEARADEIRAKYAVAVLSNIEVTTRADTLILAVKPHDVAALLEEIQPALRSGQLVISLAAGVTTAFIEARVPEGIAVVRVMPNTPALVEAGMAAVAHGSWINDAQLSEAESLMALTCRVVRVEEARMDAVTAVSGSGPAYLFLVAESMIAAGMKLGLPPDVARELVVQTLLGSATMLSDTGQDPATLRARVTSTGGTTEAAISCLEKRGLREAFVEALTAARDRAVELSGPQ
ncbi:MAG: pyrroline-5-carboxylate reductase [Nocardioides sp.]